MTDMNQMLASHHVALITVDTLRYDVAVDCMARGATPNFQHLLPDGWERRHAPGSFTYPSHQAMFAGFLPTPAADPKAERLFAMAFAGSETIGAGTCVMDAADLLSGFRQRGFHSVCIGGVGFFNQKTPLSRVLPGLFDEAHWCEAFGVTEPDSLNHQIECLATRLQALVGRKLFVFLNISALHQPNCHYVEGAVEDSVDTHAAALEYVDRQLPALLATLRAFGSWFCICCSDHGTTYGEDGYVGHRLAHAAVWDVPYGHFELSGDAQ